jgi:hypothetical protein
MRHALRAVSIAVIAIVTSGCSFLSPGADVRQASEAHAKTAWNADDSLILEEDTTHNRRVVAAEAERPEGLTMEYYPDGTPKRVEGATHHLSQCSEPKDAMAAYTRLAEKNAEVAGKLLETIQTLVPILGARIGGGGGGGSTSGPAVSAGDIQALLDDPRTQAILDQLLRSRQPATP